MGEKAGLYVILCMCIKMKFGKLVDKDLVFHPMFPNKPRVHPTHGGLTSIFTFLLSF